jgi:V8-like Glu-specific endopeptidase
MDETKTLWIVAALLLVMGVAPVNLWAQPAPIPHHIEPYFLDSGEHEGVEEKTVLLFKETVQVLGVPWLRLQFSDYNLGEKSYIVITSLLDGSSQRLDARTLDVWQGSSAYFNGDAVELELHVAPGETGIFVKIQEITVGEEVTINPDATEEICYTTDDRVSSNDPAVGRIMTIGCTGWLISNGAGLTAGHCVGTGHVLQFNVPASTSNGTPVNPPAEDQYPITYTGSTNGGEGNDWAVFRIGTNNNGDSVGQRQGAFFRMSIDLSPTTVRETGYGIDGPPPLFGDGAKNSDSQTQQTHAGPFVSETISSPSVVVIRFQIDDENGNSGSPVIDTANLVTIGIATHAGCTASGGSNAGTGFENNNLENAIQTFPGTNVEYVDRYHPVATENGTVFRPWNTVTEGVNGASSNAILSIVRGTYSESLTITKPLTLAAPVGTVIIGQ